VAGGATLLLGTLLAAPYAFADSPQDVLQELARCAETADAAERLRCFEAAAARAKALLAAPPAADTGRRQLEAFGLPQPPPPATRPEQFGKPPPRPEELQSIEAMATEFAKTARGKALFVLDNGQVWRQIDSDGSQVTNVPQRAFKVTIERGAFGSYNLTMEGRNGWIKVTRIR
jgi:hypothetical protein